MAGVLNVNEVIHHHQPITSVTFHEQGLLLPRAGRPCAPPATAPGQQNVALHEASVLIHWLRVGAMSVPAQRLCFFAVFVTSTNIYRQM
jgi:hypothetical protein